MHLDLSDAAWNIELPCMDEQGHLEHDFQYRHSWGSLALSTSLPKSAAGDDVVRRRRLMAGGSTSIWIPSTGRDGLGSGHVAWHIRPRP